MKDEEIDIEKIEEGINFCIYLNEIKEKWKLK
jgi:hypothetical protein